MARMEMIGDLNDLTCEKKIKKNWKKKIKNMSRERFYNHISKNEYVYMCALIKIK